ncbi:hypothetical protein D9M71_463650 [compost metagenome]
MCRRTPTLKVWRAIGQASARGINGNLRAKSVNLGVSQLRVDSPQHGISYQPERQQGPFRTTLSTTARRHRQRSPDSRYPVAAHSAAGRAIGCIAQDSGRGLFPPDLRQPAQWQGGQRHLHHPSPHPRTGSRVVHRPGQRPGPGKMAGPGQSAGRHALVAGALRLHRWCIEQGAIPVRRLAPLQPVRPAPDPHQQCPLRSPPGPAGAARSHRPAHRLRPRRTLQQQ